MKLLRLAVLTVCAFCVSWLPFSTCNLLIASGNSCGGKDVERTLFTLAFFNSVINPIIYFFHNRNGIRALFPDKQTAYSTVHKTSNATMRLSSVTTQGRTSSSGVVNTKHSATDSHGKLDSLSSTTPATTVTDEKQTNSYDNEVFTD